MRHGIAMSALALGLALVSCERTGSRDAPEHREHSGAARRVAPPDLRLAARPIEHIAAGYEHTCVRFRDGAVRCWGRGAGGRLGTGATVTIGDDETPAAISDVVLGGRAVQIAAGREHTCALLDTGTVRCWGVNIEGQLGYGHTRDIGDDEAPASAGDVPLGEPVTQIMAGHSYTCALLASGRVRCWGGSSQRTGGIGDDALPTPSPPLDLGGLVTRLGNPRGVPCARLESGSVRCWEPSSRATGGFRHVAEDALIELGIPEMRPQSSAGAKYTCAMTMTGRLRCWGERLDGEGDPNDATGAEETWAALPALANLGDAPSTGNGRVTEVALGGELTCALLDTGRVRCWGVHGSGNLDQVLDENAIEIDVGGRVVEMAGGALHVCAVLDTGHARCWGSNAAGQLGYGRAETVGEHRSPAAVGDVPL